MSVNRIEKLLEYIINEPNDPFLQYALATEYLAKDDTYQAQNYFENLVKNHPNYIGTYYHLGKLYEKLQLNDKALITYEQGIKIAKDIKDHHALSELLNVYNALNDEMLD